MLAFSNLERAVLNAICDVHPDFAEIIQAQIAAAQVTARENTGSGMIVDIEVDPTAPRLPIESFTSADVTTAVAGLTLHCFIRFDAGLIVVLEGIHEAGGNVDTGGIDMTTVPFTSPISAL